MAIDPSNTVPADTATVKSLVSVTEESARQSMRQPVLAAFGAAQYQFGDITKTVLGGIAKALKGIFDPKGWFAGIGQASQGFRDGQNALKDRTDLLSTLLDYASAYMPQGTKLNSLKEVPFTAQIGPARNVEINKAGRFILKDKGLWDIRAHIVLDSVGIFTAQNIRVSVRVYKPSGQGGTLYSEQTSFEKTLNSTSFTIVSSVVVPAADYEIAIAVEAAKHRVIQGGPKWSRMTVQHISRAVTNFTGSEGSDELAPNPDPEDDEATVTTEPPEEGEPEGETP